MQASNPHTYEVDFPPKSQMWPGAILASICHAMFVAKEPFMDFLQSWDGNNYSMNNGQGCRCTVVFGHDHDRFVGAFCDNNIRASNSVNDTESSMNIADLRLQVPNELLPCYEEALLYLLQEVNGNAVPIATAIMWSDPLGSTIASVEPWQRALVHGASLVRHHFVSPQIAIAHWAREFDLNDDLSEYAMSLFVRRIRAKHNVVLDASDLAMLTSIARCPNGVSSCLETLESVGIVFPN